MTDKLFEYVCTPDDAPKFLQWFKERGGVAVWENPMIGDSVRSWMTPYLTEEGLPMCRPTWKAAEKPDHHITDMSEMFVIVPKEVKRFRVAVRRGSQGLSLKLTDASSKKIRSAVDRANDKGDDQGAWYELDYSTQEAVIFVVDKKQPLKEYADGLNKAD